MTADDSHLIFFISVACMFGHILGAREFHFWLYVNHTEEKTSDTQGTLFINFEEIQEI